MHVAATRVSEVRQEIRSIEILQQWDSPSERAEQLRTVLHAVDTWQRWATGKPMPPNQVVGILDNLRSEAASDRPECTAPAAAVNQWARRLGIVATPAAVTPPTPPPPSQSFGIEP